jgi:hypothetical protein
MHIQFVRSGGFAGLRMTTEIDSEDLSQEELQNLREALDNANFFSLPEQMMADLGSADRFQYEITVDDGIRHHTVVANDASMPGEMQPLVSHLERLARTHRGQRQ